MKKVYCIDFSNVTEENIKHYYKIGFMLLTLLTKYSIDLNILFKHPALSWLYEFLLWINNYLPYPFYLLNNKLIELVEYLLNKLTNDKVWIIIK